MAMKYGFFNAVQQSDGTYDRSYDAEFFTRLLSTAFYNAVPANAFTVSAGTGLMLNISSGSGFINGVFFYDDDTTSLTCSSASGTRTDLVVARLNASARMVELAVSEGTTTVASNEIALAQVTVSGSSVSAVANITASRVSRIIPHITYGTAEPPDSGNDGEIYLKYVN